MIPVLALTRYYAEGGPVTEGNPASRTDDVHAMLQHGEYVVNRAATREMRQVLEQINTTYRAEAAPTKPAAERLARALSRAAERVRRG